MPHKLINIRNLSSTAYVIRLERKNIIFKAGQCLNLGIKGSGVNREYSIYSGEIGERAKRYFKGGNGALIGLELSGGTEAVKKFINSLKLN